MKIEPEIQTFVGKLKGGGKKILIVGTLSAVVIISLGWGLFYFFQNQSWLRSRLDRVNYSVLNHKAYYESLINHDPKLIQDSFVADIKNGVNDEFTKSDAYFLTHRYFDNGGNVYEIYDYINSHSSLAFLKEAEDIYPDIFDQIRNKTLPPIPYSRPSLFAVLAYLEILDNHGYADIAALGTLANQYAKTAYFTKKKSEENPINGADPAPMVQNITEKAIRFELKAKNMLNGMSQGGEFLTVSIADRSKPFDEKSLPTSVTASALLVGLNQYGACLRYLEATGVNISTAIDSSVNASDVFAFDMVLAKKAVPELEIFTSLLNASTLSLVSPESAGAIKTALKPILAYNATKPAGIIEYLVKAKDDKYGGLDIYGKRNAVNLASIVPEFKKWLISGGWSEADFR